MRNVVLNLERSNTFYGLWDRSSMVEGKMVTTDHPVAYVSRIFRGSQLNWAALTKEAFAIYMSVKKFVLLFN